MNPTEIKKAKEEARRFIADVESLEQAMKETKSSFPEYCPRECGIVRARSIILWRQLAKMRKPY